VPGPARELHHRRATSWTLAPALRLGRLVLPGSPLRSVIDDSLVAGGGA
jgi:hypothetical protein